MKSSRYSLVLSEPGKFKKLYSSVHKMSAICRFTLQNDSADTLDTYWHAVCWIKVFQLQISSVTFGIHGEH